jgi:alpha-amylase
MRNFIRDVKEKQGQDFYVFGEFWNGKEEDNNTYLEKTENRFDLVDVRLHYNLHNASLRRSRLRFDDYFRSFIGQKSP